MARRYRAAEDDPQALASNLFARVSRPYYTSDDPRYTRTFAEQAAAVEAVTSMK
jgi:hypothetical protein